MLPRAHFELDCNPVEQLLKMVITKDEALRAENTRLLAEDARIYNEGRSVIQAILVDENDPLSNQKAMAVKRKLAAKQSPYTRVNPLKKFGYVFSRTTKNLFVDKMLFVVFNVQMMTLAAIIIGIYKDMRRNYDDVPEGSDESPDISNRIGSMFFITINFYCCFLVNSAFTMDAESVIVYREISTGIMSPMTYFWSKSLSDLTLSLPPLFIQIVLVIFCLHTAV